MTDQSTSRPAPPVHGEIIPENRAKQGRQGFSMLAVLVISIALLAMIYLGIYFAHARPTADTGARDAAQRTASATKSTP